MIKSNRECNHIKIAFSTYYPAIDKDNKCRICNKIVTDLDRVKILCVNMNLKRKE